MAKHIHIHLTRDAGFDESKHKRSAGGQFATSAGNAAHHEAQAGAHTAAAGKANSTAQYQQHAAAAKNHKAAAECLRKAEGRAQMGKAGESKSHHEMANVHANAAAEAEKTIASMAATPLSQAGMPSDHATDVGNILQHDPDADYDKIHAHPHFRKLAESLGDPNAKMDDHWASEDDPDRVGGISVEAKGKLHHFSFE